MALLEAAVREALREEVTAEELPPPEEEWCPSMIK
jgi:hypothetical protein